MSCDPDSANPKVAGKDAAGELLEAELEKVSGGQASGQTMLVFKFKLVSVGPSGGGTKYEAAVGRIGSCTATHD